MQLFGRSMSASKQFLIGTHRTRAPEDTFAEYRRFMPGMGITRIANVTGLDRIGLPVCVAIRPNARSLATSQGKGETLMAARVSAMMESIESWHGERVEGPVMVGSYESMRRVRRVVDPQQLAVRADATLFLDRPMEWIAGWDLMAEEPAWVPYETVTTDFVQAPDRHPVFLKSTNGLASGNHPLEAVLHGLLEVIERDALTLWQFLPVARRHERQVDLSTVADPHLADVIRTIRGAGLAIAAWDITSDLGIPTFTCTLIEDPESPQWHPVPAMSGHGTHLDPLIALSRAVHEAIQSRVTMISGSRDDMFPHDYRDAGERADHRREIAAWREPGPGLRFEPAAHATSTFDGDLAVVLERLSAAGVTSVVAVDLSRADIGIPVAKVVVPGLEPVQSAVYRMGARARAVSRELAA